MKNNFIKRMMALSIISATLLTALPTGASATNIVTTNIKTNQWLQVNGKWEYNDATGNPIKSSWFNEKSTGKNYYLDSNGIMQTGWMKDTNGKYYYLNTDGSLAVSTIINGYTVGSDGAWIENDTVSNTNSNLPIQIPSNWRSLGDNKYSINNRSVVTYSVSDMTGWTQDSVMNDLRKITYQQGNYDSDMGLVTYNGNNGYAYSYTIVTKENMRKVLYIVIFKNNKHYDFILASEYENYNADRQELENALNSSLVLN